MKYTPYPTSATQKNRRERKKQRHTIFRGNRALHSTRAKKGEVTEVKK